MFESVGREIDPDLRRRQALLAAWTTGIGAVVVGAVVCVTAQVAPVVLAAAEDEEPPPELVQLDLDPTPIAPEAPAAPRIAQGSPTSTAAPTPPEPTSAPTLTPAPPAEMVASDVPKGSADGDPNGDPEGTRDGVPGGRPGGTGTGSADGGIRAMSQAAIEWTRQPQPTYPAAARGLGLGEQRCVVKMHLDTRGVPADVTVSGCVEAFHPGTLEALTGWRAYPVRLGGTKIEVRTTVVVYFKER